jgi:hypothetical protein
MAMIAVLAGLATAATPGPPSSQPEYVPGMAIVKLRQGLVNPESTISVALARVRRGLSISSMHRLFPKIHISEEVREKILRRNGSVDPDTSYARLGMDRWYVVTLSSKDVDVPALCHRLEADSTRIEHAGPNGIMHLMK